LFCCLSKKYILCCPINRCKVSHHYFALLVDLSSFFKQNMSYANVVLVFHSPMRTSKNGHITNAKRTIICQVGFSTDTRADPFFVVAESKFKNRQASTCGKNANTDRKILSTVKTRPPRFEPRALLTRTQDRLSPSIQEKESRV